MQDAVERVIEMMRANLGERITVDDMARTAMFSKFHFTRRFQEITGVSPGRFLSALRLAEAKRLLLTTSLTVTEISNRVGYSSVGTFSSRFKNSVGLAPSAFRQTGGYRDQMAAGNGRRPAEPAMTVQGRIHPWPMTAHGPVFVGLFPGCVPEGVPVSCAVLRAPGDFTLDNVPRGTWYLLAHSVAPGHDGFDEARSFVGVYGPITMHPETIVKPANVRLRPKQVLDPPVLLAFVGPDPVAVAVEAS
ncbi:AraC family transcriptional regulator [Actinomadura sp. CNU-125]|uniref:helix-turn-helix domain-containing protein n=1 Tax=Actinomadura sp. CNU-125 TaxID=1904961 RepID=UPI00095AA864|nr:AraC family transcriptional regulator [Actinomadura sp. CNU-125]OLT19097.1 AraC family transcriptional regulator [Actinomadura sp. CNU-125]